MTQGKKIITPNGLTLLTGSHPIQLKEASTSGELSVKESQGKHKATCRLTLSTEKDGNTIGLQLTDKGCDGVESAKYRINDGKWKKITPRSKNQIPRQLQNPDQVMERAIEQIASHGPQGRQQTVKRIVPQGPSLTPISPPTIQRPKRVEIIVPQTKSRSAKRIQAKTYFATGKAKLKSTKALDKFVKDYSGGPIIVEGHCDFRGGVEDNLELGGKRAGATKEYLQQAFKDAGKPIPSISTVSYGESKSRSARQKDRRAVVTSAVKVIDQALGTMKGDVVYLIDSSGSMRGELWNQVRNYFRSNRPGKGRLFNFDNNGVKRGLGRVDGGTHLWDSIHDTIAGTKDNPSPYAHKIAAMIKGQHLIVLTDGIDEGSKHTAEEVRKLASNRGIKLSIIFLGEYTR